MPLLGWIGTTLFTFALSNIRVLAKVFSINFLIFAAFVAASIAALTTFIESISTTIDTLVVTNVPIVPFFIPSNFVLCISAYVTVEFACVTYAITSRWLANKAYIFKA